MLDIACWMNAVFCQVEVGKQYEIVVSNPYGLYRNRFGDVVEIVGFYKTLPKYRFLYR